MKALMLKELEKVSVEEVPVAPVGPNDVKVRVKRCMLCGTDYDIYTGNYKVLGDFPHFIGHELSGFVEEVGSRVKHIEPGRMVATSPVQYCGECYRCRNGQEHFCERIAELWKATGGFSEYIVVDAKRVFTIPDGITLDQAAFVEPVSVCVHCIDMAEIKPGMRVAITGAGPIGLILLQLAIRSGAGLTMVSEPEESKRKMAMDLGADFVVDPVNEDIVLKSQEVTSRRGFDVVIEASGNEQAVKDSYMIAGRKSTLFFFAVYPVDFEFSIRPFVLYLKELTIKGVFFSPYTFPRTIDILPKLELDKLISHRLPLEKSGEIFEIYKEGKALKIMVEC